MIGSAIARYQQVKITTTSPGELLVALFDGLFRFLRSGADALREGKRSKANHALSRSHAILSELVVSLDPNHAPELCSNLERLYGFCLDQVLAANLHNDPAPLEDVIRVLSPVREAFREAVSAVARGETTATLPVPEGAP